MKPRVSINELWLPLKQHGFSDRNIRFLERDAHWASLLYRNHQLVFLSQNTESMFQIDLTVRDLQEIFHLGETTVREILRKGYSQPNSGGHPMLVSENIENELVEIILAKEKAGEPIGPTEFLTFLQEKKGIHASKGWLHDFLERNSEKLQIANSYPEEASRLNVPREFLEQHIANTKNVVANCCSELLINLDEVGASEYEDQTKKTVIVSSKTDPNSVQHPVSRNLKHQTLLAAITASGNCLPPMLITSTDISQKMIEKGYRQNQSILFRTRQPPYMTADLFKEYIQAIIIPYVKAVRMNPPYSGEPAVLMMDGFPGHLRNDILQLLGQNGIKVFCFPAHTSNLFQELDLVLFGAMKRTRSNQSVDENDPEIIQFAEQLIKALLKELIDPNIIASFRRAGFTIDTLHFPYRVVFDEAILRSNPQFQEIYDKDIHVDEITLRRRMHTFGFVNEQFYIPPNPTNYH